MKTRKRKHQKIVTNCARCGRVHEDISFEELDRPSLINRYYFSHWTVCPTNGQPILMGKQDYKVVGETDG